MSEDVQLIPIDKIRVINPRHREQKKFQVIVQSIKNLGLKKPVKVSLRNAQEGNEPGYDLVAGQGRLEACKILGHKEIPAIVVAISKEDRLLMSLIENLARRFPSSMDLVAEVQRLKEQGYTNQAIGEKLDIDNMLVAGLLSLAKNGEERLLQAAMQNKVPIGVAIEISKADTPEAQRELLQSYESGSLNQVPIRALKRLMEQRQLLGKKRSSPSAWSAAMAWWFPKRLSAPSRSGTPIARFSRSSMPPRKSPTIVSVKLSVNGY
jgi:ParB family chromosome partitioning protein